MKLSTRLAIIVASAVLGLIIIASFALSSLNSTIVDERKASIDLVLRLATHEISYYQGLEKEGKLSHDQAQAQAKQVIRSLQDQGDYVFLRRMDGFVLVHPDVRKEGKIDGAGKMPDGRTGMQGYLDVLAKGESGYVQFMVEKPGESAFVPKINGVRHIAGWDWIVGYGAYIDDVSALFWKQALQFMGIGLAILLLMVGAAVVLARQIYQRLGGEPDYAADAAIAIANGDLSCPIVTHGRQDSLLGAMRIGGH